MVRRHEELLLVMRYILLSLTIYMCALVRGAHRLQGAVRHMSLPGGGVSALGLSRHAEDPAAERVSCIICLRYRSLHRNTAHDFRPQP